MKWIKLIVGMFDGNSFKKIKKAKIGGESFRDKLTAVWFELMDFAGKCNAGGKLVESTDIPFSSIEDIALLIDREPSELELCMNYYIANHMITVVDEVYMLKNWSKYQSADKLAEIREQTRARVAKSREKKKTGECNGCNATVALHVTDVTLLEEEGEEEIEEREENERKNERKNETGDASFKHSSDIDSLPVLSTDLSTREDAKRQMMGGTLGKGVVFLSPKQLDDLLDKLSLEEFNHYVTVIADQELSGKHYTRKTHYRAILDMAEKDRRTV